MLGTKKVNFDDMDFNQFVFGESRLINRSKITSKEKETRIHLMQRISKLNSKFGSEVATKLYRDTLNGIEKKEFKWGNLNEVQRIEMDIKFDNLKIEGMDFDSESRSKKQTKKGGKERSPDVVCAKISILENVHFRSGIFATPVGTIKARRNSTKINPKSVLLRKNDLFQNPCWIYTQHNICKLAIEFFCLENLIFRGRIFQSGNFGTLLYSNTFLQITMTKI